MRKGKEKEKGKAKTRRASSGRQSVTLYICRSCVWSEAKRESDGKRQGEFLFEAIKQKIDLAPLPKNTALRAVHCLNGCKSPCNVAFRSPGKHGLRFSRLTSESAGDVLSLLYSYRNSEFGDLQETEMPKSMRGKLTVRTPPSPIRSR